MRKVLIAVLVLAGVYVAADFGIRFLAQGWVGKELQTSLDLSERPSVSLGGFPFIPHFVGGDLPTVSATANNFQAQGISFAKVTLTLHGVRFSPTRLTRGTDTTISIHDGTGEATMTAESLTTALHDAGAPVTVRFEGGRIIAHSPDLGRDVILTPSMSHGRLVLQSGELPGALRVDLPDVVPGVHYAGLHVTASVAVFALRVEHATLKP